MKIPKIRSIDGSKVLREQARILSTGPTNEGDASIGGGINESILRALEALSAENVEPLTKRKRIYPGTIADPAIFNDLFQGTREDLEAIVDVSDALRSAMLAYYNIISTKENNVIGQLKTLRNKISTLKLYASNITEDDQYMVYSFTDGTEIGVPTGKNVATYSEEEGALLLPVDMSAIVLPEISSIEVMEGSNGSIGNSLERERTRHANPKLMIDGQEHTWFEYEKIAGTRGETLQLELKLTLKTPTVVNRIRINPANLGTSSWVKIEDIKIDTGNGFLSIKEDISTPSWSPTDPFQLAPAASKFAGQGVYTFSPLIAQAIQISIVQTEPYPVGSKLRYAIGIRDIEIAQVPFASEGEFLLTPKKFPRPVTAIGFMHNAAPYDSKFIKIEYQVSTDNGFSWKEVVPLDNIDTAKTEALILDTPSDSLIIKGKISRDGARFTSKGTSPRLQNLEKVISLSGVASTKYSLDAPRDSYLEVIRLGLGSVGNSANPLFLGIVPSSTGFISFELPVRIPRDKIVVVVNGKEMEQVDAFDGENDEGYIYYDVGSTPRIVFGNGTDGKPPAAGSEVYVRMEVDRKAVFSGERPYRIDLSYQSDKIKSTTKVMLRDTEIKSAKAYAGPNSNWIVIPPNRRLVTVSQVTNGNVYTPLNPGDSNKALGGSSFLNGRTEFNGVDGRKYSTDWENGTVYVNTPNDSEIENLEMSYNYSDAIEIPDWEYHPTANSIMMNTGLFTPRVKSLPIEAPINNRYLHLLEDEVYTVMKGSVRAIDSENDLRRLLDSELEFIDGATEFTTIQDSNLEGYYSVDYKNAVLYLPPGITFPVGTLQFQYVAVEISYGLGEKLELNRDYTLEGQDVILTPSYINTLAERGRNRPDRSRAVIRHDARVAIDLGGAELEQFYSPVIRDIAVIGISADPRLGTLESL